LEEAVNRPQSDTQVHAAHMCLARLYQDEGNSAKAEEHYKAALAETEKAGLYRSTAIWLARFYVEQHRYSEAEPLFQRVLDIREADRTSNSSLPHHLDEFAKVYEAQKRYSAAEELYRRAVKISEELDGPREFLIVRALDNLARFYQARGRYPEAEELSRKSLGIVEERMKSQTAERTKGWLRWRNSKKVDATIRRARVPISAALDQLAEIYECQEKYAEAEPLRRRSFEIKEQAWGETLAWIWVDSLAAYANALHKIGREPEAAKLDERVEAIRANYPQGSVRSHVRLMSMPIKRTLRGRFTTFINTLLHPSPR
jgi:tetratricopeptide (TPR) repeat protein